MPTVLDQLASMRTLPENWDGYGAAPPCLQALTMAEQFVELLGAMARSHSSDDQIIYVSPTRTGGVMVEWEDRLFEHEIEFGPDRSIEFLRTEKATGRIETRKLLPESPTVVQPAFLAELRHLIAA